jgi:hypothetical protein
MTPGEHDHLEAARCERGTVPSARRAVSVPSWLPDVIDRHLADYPPDPEGLIFSAPGSGPIRRNTFLWR